MNSYYGPQNSYYGQPNTYYAPAPQPQYAPLPVAPQSSGSGMKMAAAALALLAIGIGAFALMLGMKNSNVETTSAQSTPSTVFNIPSEINIPSLGTTSSPSAPVVVNNPAPRVITIPGQAPVQQSPVQQQAPVVDQPGANGGQAIIQAQKDAEAKAAADAAAKKAEEDAAATKAANAKKAASLRAEAVTLRAQANQMRLDASLLSPDKEAVNKALAEAQTVEDQATAKDNEAAALG